MPQAAENYLNRWRSAFELFGEGQRFLQVPNLEPKREGEAATSVSKLDVAMATGNNPTLFDNGGGTARQIPPSRLALLLLTFQCFSPGGRIGVAEWSGQPTGDGSSEHAPCVSRSMLHTFLRGRDLSATLHLNVLHKEQVQELAPWGQPVWERMPNSHTDEHACRNATGTYLGRLAPLARAVRLYENSCEMLYANALTYPEIREPTATEIVRNDSKGAERNILSASLDKATWRELNAITVKSSIAQVGGSLALQNLTSADHFECWAGGLVASKAKLLDSIESVFHIPAAMLADSGQAIYHHGVKFADSAQARLFRAIDAYCREYGRTPGDKPRKEGSKEQRAHSRTVASTHFWTALEQGVPDLLAVVDEPALLGLDRAWRNTEWGKLVERTAAEAFGAACPRATQRQMRAYAAARLRLWENITNDGKKHRSRSGKPAQVLA